MIWKRIAQPLGPIMTPYDAEGPLGDYAALLEMHAAIFALPRMDRATATIKLAGWAVDDDVTVDWEGETWWSGQKPPEPAARLAREIRMFRFAMPTVDAEDAWVQTITLDRDGITVDISGKGPRPSYIFHIRQGLTGWQEGCTVWLRPAVMTDVVDAIGSGDLNNVLAEGGLRFAGGCPMVDHRFHDGIFEAATTTIVMAALRDDTEHHQGERQ